MLSGGFRGETAPQHACVPLPRRLSSTGVKSKEQGADELQMEEEERSGLRLGVFGERITRISCSTAWNSAFTRICWCFRALSYFSTSIHGRGLFLFNTLFAGVLFTLSKEKVGRKCHLRAST